MVNNITGFMRKVITLFLIILLGMFSCKENSGEIKDILEKCREIDKDSKDYTLKIMDGFPNPENNTIKGYYKGKDPSLLVIESYRDTCRIFTHIYFNANEIICAVEQKFVYNKPNTYTEEIAKAQNDSVWYDDKKTILKTGSMYFKENKLNKWLTNDNAEIPSSSSLFANKQDEIIEEALLAIKMFKEKDKDLKQ